MDSERVHQSSCRPRVFHGTLTKQNISYWKSQPSVDQPNENVKVPYFKNEISRFVAMFAKNCRTLSYLPNFSSEYCHIKDINFDTLFHTISVMSFEFTIWPIGSFKWCLDNKDYHSLQEQHDLYIRTYVRLNLWKRQSENHIPRNLWFRLAKFWGHTTRGEFQTPSCASSKYRAYIYFLKAPTQSKEKNHKIQIALWQNSIDYPTNLKGLLAF